MNQKLAKKLRKLARQRDEDILPELKAFINLQPFSKRLSIAIRIIKGKF